MKTARLALRVAALAVTGASIVFMLFPDTLRAPMLALGLGGQFVVGTVIVAALAVEVLSLATRR